MDYTSVPEGYYRAEGTIKNFNTFEEYRDSDKPQMLQQAGQTVSLTVQKVNEVY